MDSYAQNEIPEKQKRKKRIKRKLLPSILAGFSLPITLFLYGPFDLFAQNRAEFAFALSDFILPCILLTLVCGAVLSIIPLFLRKKAYSLYTALLFWASVMLYVQGNYLNFGLASIAGDGVGDAIKTSTVVINTVIWAVTLAAVVFAVLKFKQVRLKLKTVVAFGMALVLVMEGVGTVAVSVSKDNVFGSPLSQVNKDNSTPSMMLTNENLTELSTDSNVVVFVIDRFDVNNYYEALAKRPEIFEEMEGFTHYSDHVSLYCRTYPAIVNMVTGQRHSYDMKREEFFEYAYGNANYIEYLKDKGYSINIYTDKFFGYSTAADMAGCIDNSVGYDDYEVTDKWGLFGSMLAFSAYRYFPFALKGTVSQISTNDFFDMVEFKSGEDCKEYDYSNVGTYKTLTGTDFTFDEKNDKKFSFIHFDGCHTPNASDENFNILDEYSYDVENVMVQSFKIINRYLQEMKRLGVYEDATIIITGDHAYAVSDTEPVADKRITAMFVKPSGVSEGAIVTSNAPTCHDDVWPTIFASEGLKHYPEVQGRSMLDIGENEQREREYIFHRLVSGKNEGPMEEIFYKITGSARDFSNWEIVERKTHDIGVYE